MQVALEVNNSTPDQAPETTTEQTNTIQQTRSGEGLGAPAQPASAADQQQLLELLHSEASSSSYGAPADSHSAGHAAVQLGVGAALIFVVVIVAVICQQQLNKLYAPSKPKRPAKRSK